jgi:hypothetical protein
MSDTPRTIGPVTSATTGAAALTALVCWILELNGINVPDDIQAQITIVVVLLAGYAVKPRQTGEHAA